MINRKKKKAKNELADKLKEEKYAANCTGSKLSQCSAIIFLMRMSHRIRQY